MARTRRRASGRRADLHWENAATTSTFTQALSAGTRAATMRSASTDRSCTLMRTRGNLTAMVNALGAPGRSGLISVGLIIVPGGTGATVLSSPFTDGEAPWFWYETFHLFYEEMVSDVIDVPVVSGFRSVVDSQAMRVIRPDQEIQIVAENTTLENAVSVNVAAGFRFLFAD